MTASKNEHKEILLPVEQILQWTDGVCSQPPHAICTSVFTDSRKVIPGGLFVALKGETFNGNQFAEAALKQGAAAALVSEKIPEIPGKNIIYVPNTLEALQKIAHGYRRQFPAKIIAVTGSVGKTTTKDLLSWCLQKKYCTLKTEANHNNDIGVPETLLKLRTCHEAAVVEMGMRARGEIERLSRITEPDVVLITNIAPVHFETLGSLENIAKAKCEIFSHLKPHGWGMIAGDYPLLYQEARKMGRTFYTFGSNPTCNCRLLATEMTPEKMDMKVCLFDWEGTLTFPIPSEAIALDVVAAAGCAYLLGLTPKEIIQALASYVEDQQRLHIERFTEGGLVLNDTYNANPLSMVAALDVLRFRAKQARKVAVLGDMYELGSLEREGHLQVGQKAAASQLDVLITIGELGKIIAEGAKEAGMLPEKILSFPDPGTALPWMKAHLTHKDAILFKASHGLHLDRLLKQWENGGETSHE